MSDTDVPKTTAPAICEACDGSGQIDPMLSDADPANEPCQTCEGSGQVFVRRNSRGQIDYIDGSPTSETTRCDMCHGEGVRL